MVVHCDSEEQAGVVLAGIAERLASLGLELHPDKTTIVYCKDANRRGNHEHTSFDFLGYTFRGRRVKGQWGFFVTKESSARKSCAIKTQCASPSGSSWWM